MQLLEYYILNFSARLLQQNYTRFTSGHCRELEGLSGLIGEGRVYKEGVKSAGTLINHPQALNKLTSLFSCISMDFKVNYTEFVLDNEQQSVDNAILLSVGLYENFFLLFA